MSTANCLAQSGKETAGSPKGCILDYKSGPFQYPPAGHLLAPWVSIDFVDMKFQGSAGAVTVSNRSSDSTDPKHCAVIKSFSLGHSEGTDVSVVIHDTHGGNFEAFMNHLFSDWMCVKKIDHGQLLMKVRFGWTKSGSKEPVPVSSSKCYYIICSSIEANFTEGKIVFDIVGHDVVHRMPEGAAEFQVGGEGDKGVHFLHAVMQFLTDPNSPAPNISAVKFILNEGKSKSEYTFDSKNPPKGSSGPNLFNMDEEKEKRLGLLGKWSAQGLNKIEAVRKWAHQNPSANNNNWIIRMDTTLEKPTLVFEENSVVRCGNESDSYFDSLSLGTYIVNGGPLSPVVEFNPKIKWDFTAPVGAGAGSSGVQMNESQKDGGKHQGGECMPKEKSAGAGQITSVEPHENQINKGGKILGKDEEHEGVIKRTVSIIPYGVAADLVIVGDPSFCPPNESVGIKFVSIVVINPFHIAPEGSGSGGDWLAQPICNEVLSNKGWLVKSVNHRIDAGSYHTTIGVELSTPGITLPAGNKLGGWEKGWKPKSC